MGDVDTYALWDTETRIDDDGIVYEHSNVTDPAVEDPFDEYRHSVSMPTPILEANTEHVDGTVATWHLHEEAPDRLFASSELGTDVENVSDVDLPEIADDDLPEVDVPEPDMENVSTPEVDDVDVSPVDDVVDGDDRADDDSQPVPGPVAAIAVLIATAVLAWWRG